MSEVICKCNGKMYQKKTTSYKKQNTYVSKGKMKQYEQLLIHSKGWIVPFTQDQVDYAVADAIWTMHLYRHQHQHRGLV